MMCTWMIILDVISVQVKTNFLIFSLKKYINESVLPYIYLVNYCLLQECIFLEKLNLARTLTNWTKGLISLRLALSFQIYIYYKSILTVLSIKSSFCCTVHFDLLSLAFWPVGLYSRIKNLNKKSQECFIFILPAPHLCTY